MNNTDSSATAHSPEHAEQPGVIHQLMDACATLGASDLHLSHGLPATYRIRGQIHAAGEHVYNGTEVDAMACVLMSELQLSQFRQDMTLDMGFSTGGGNRFRVNVYREQGNTALAIRYLDGSLKSTRELGLPPQMEYLAQLKSGLVLVCGATGSGKSTTLIVRQNGPQNISQATSNQAIMPDFWCDSIWQWIIHWPGLSATKAISTVSSAPIRTVSRTSLSMFAAPLWDRTVKW